MGGKARKVSRKQGDRTTVRQYDKRLWAASMVLRQLPLWLGKPSMRLLVLLVPTGVLLSPPEIAPRKHYRPPKRQGLVDLQVAQAF
jgi:hypothetical protein